MGVNLKSAKHSAGLGIVLMAVSMLVVPVVDGTAKYLSAAHSPLFLGWARYASACLFVLPWALAKHARAFLPAEGLMAHGLRTIFLAAAMTCYFLAIAIAPLADVTAAYFVGPIVAMALAVLLLGERLTPRKLISLILGFGGALVIVNRTAALNPGIVLGVVSGVLFALYMIATRQASRGSDPVKTLAFQCLFGAILLAPQAIWTWSTPSTDELWLFLAMGGVSAACHFMSITAFRHAEASILAPLVYLELVGAVIVGYLLFGDVPGATVWFGAAAIVGGGALLAQRRGNSAVADEAMAH